MKKLYSFLAGIVAIILVLWGIATHLDSKINSRDSQKLVIYNWGGLYRSRTFGEIHRRNRDPSPVRDL